MAELRNLARMVACVTGTTLTGWQIAGAATPTILAAIPLFRASRPIGVTRPDHIGITAEPNSIFSFRDRHRRAPATYGRDHQRKAWS